MGITENAVNISQYRGPVSRCRMCRNSDPAALPEQKGFCKFCLGFGYVAACLNCDGKGLVGGGNVWGNAGKSDYHSTCNICGGTGLIPAKAADFVEPSTPVAETGKIDDSTSVVQSA